MKPSPHLSHLKNEPNQNIGEQTKFSPVGSFSSVDFPVPLQHLNSHKTVATEVTGKRFLVAVLPNRMRSQIISAREPLQTSLNIKEFYLICYLELSKRIPCIGMDPTLCES